MLSQFLRNHGNSKIILSLKSYQHKFRRSLCSFQDRCSQHSVKTGSWNLENWINNCEVGESLLVELHLTICTKTSLKKRLKTLKSLKNFWELLCGSLRNCINFCVSYNANTVEICMLGKWPSEPSVNFSFQFAKIVLVVLKYFSFFRKPMLTKGCVPGSAAAEQRAGCSALFRWRCTPAVPRAHQVCCSVPCRTPKG